MGSTSIEGIHSLDFITKRGPYEEHVGAVCRLTNSGAAPASRRRTDCLGKSEGSGLGPNGRFVRKCLKPPWLKVVFGNKLHVGLVADGGSRGWQPGWVWSVRSMGDPGLTWWAASAQNLASLGFRKCQPCVCCLAKCSRELL